jgi:hypothetical protein
VRLTVDGKTSSAPIVIKMDPRVKISAATLENKFQAEKHMAEIMTASAQALLEGGSIRVQLEKLAAVDDAQGYGPTKIAVEAALKKLAAVLGASGGFFAPPSADNTLSRLNGQAGTLYQEVWQADAEPTSSQLQALSATERDSADVLKRWSDFKNTDLPALNRLLHDSKIPEVQLGANLHQEEEMMEDEE